MRTLIKVNHLSHLIPDPRIGKDLELSLIKAKRRGPVSLLFSGRQSKMRPLWIFVEGVSTSEIETRFFRESRRKTRGSPSQRIFRREFQEALRVLQWQRRNGFVHGHECVGYRSLFMYLRLVLPGFGLTSISLSSMTSSKVSHIMLRFEPCSRIEDQIEKPG